jgi:hypothetical protein
VSGREEGTGEDGDEGRSDWLGWKLEIGEISKKKVVKNFVSMFGVRPSGDPTRPPGVTTLNETLTGIPAVQAKFDNLRSDVIQ